MVEEADVWEELGAIGEAVWEAAGGSSWGMISDGPGMSRGSVTGRAVRGASVDSAPEPGENHTSTFTKPVSMIENIRTSKYDRCSDTSPHGGRSTRD
jgi:hypothetical protein